MNSALERLEVTMVTAVCVTCAVVPSRARITLKANQRPERGETVEMTFDMNYSEEPGRLSARQEQRIGE